MQSFMYTIRVPVGLHARHAAIIVKAAREFESTITISFEDKTADARRILGLMGLGIKQGDLIRVNIEGPDEYDAAVAMKNVFWNHF